jgi:hypothetical protein
MSENARRVCGYCKATFGATTIGRRAAFVKHRLANISAAIFPGRLEPRHHLPSNSVDFLSSASFSRLATVEP